MLVRFCCRSGKHDRKSVSQLTGCVFAFNADMITNIIEQGFKDGKPHYIDVRAVYEREKGVTLVVRDDCRPFDPKERFRYLADDDPATNIGLRIIMNMARDLSYTSALRLNNLTIKV